MPIWMKWRLDMGAHTLMIYEYVCMCWCVYWVYRSAKWVGGCECMFACVCVMVVAMGVCSPKALTPHTHTHTHAPLSPKGAHFALHGNSSNDEDAGSGTKTKALPTPNARRVAIAKRGYSCCCCCCWWNLGASVAATKEVKLLEPNAALCARSRLRDAHPKIPRKRYM